MHWLETLLSIIEEWAWLPLGLIYLAVIATILLENRNVNKSFSYIFLLVFFPIIGLVVFYYFGRDYRKRYQLRFREILRQNSIQGLEKKLTSANQQVLSHLQKQFPETSKVAVMLSKAKNSLALAGNQVELLINGEEKFPAFFDAIREARHHIHLEYYIMTFDDVGQQLLELLKQKSQEGVEVRVIADGVGSKNLRKFRKAFKHHQIEYAVYMPVTFTNLASPNYRNHRKILVVDGKVGFVGGLNLDDRYWNNGKHQLFWRDTHLRIEGPAVNMLQFNFKLGWDYLSEASFPTTPPYFHYEETGSIEAPITISSSGPISARPRGMDAMVTLIHSAKRRVRLTNPYFIPSEELKSALITTSLSGVEVQLLLPGISDSTLVQYASNSYLQPLLDNGVQVYFYQKGFLHAKTMVIDDKVSMIGTLNTDIRSFYINFEITALVYDEALALALSSQFEKDLASSKLVDLIEWENRPLSTRLFESFCRLFTPIL